MQEDCCDRIGVQHGWRCCRCASDGSTGGEIRGERDCGRSACDGGAWAERARNYCGVRARRKSFGYGTCLREGFGERRRVCVRKRRDEGTFDQSREDFYFFNG